MGNPKGVGNKAGSKQNRVSTKMKKAAMLEALNKTMGAVSLSCERCQVARATYYKWLREDKDFAEAVVSVSEKQKDFVEAQLLKRIQDGSDAAIIFYAKTKMKDRGYVEKVEVEGNNTLDVTVRIIRDGNRIEATQPPSIANGSIEQS